MDVHIHKYTTRGTCINRSYTYNDSMGIHKYRQYYTYIINTVTVMVTVTVILFQCPKNKRLRGLPLDIKPRTHIHAYTQPTDHIHTMTVQENVRKSARSTSTCGDYGIHFGMWVLLLYVCV
jgi:hypothetical protein